MYDDKLFRLVFFGGGFSFSSFLFRFHRFENGLCDADGEDGDGNKAE